MRLQAVRPQVVLILFFQPLLQLVAAAEVHTTEALSRQDCSAALVVVVHRNKMRLMELLDKAMLAALAMDQQEQDQEVVVVLEVQLLRQGLLGQ